MYSFFLIFANKLRFYNEIYKYTISRNKYIKVNKANSYISNNIPNIIENEDNQLVKNILEENLKDEKVFKFYFEHLNKDYNIMFSPDTMKKITQLHSEIDKDNEKKYTSMIDECIEEIKHHYVNLVYHCANSPAASRLFADIW